MAPPGEAYNVDWIVSTVSNVHIANDRRWFTNYTPFATQVGSPVFKQTAKVAGIGDVELKIKLRANKRRGEFNFLRAHGLSIYDEEDREDGRSLARGLIKHDCGLPADKTIRAFSYRNIKVMDPDNGLDE